MFQKYLTLAFVFFALSISAVSQDSAAKLISTSNFTISAEDEAAGIDGEIKIALDINKSGEVTNAVVYIAPMWPCGVELYSRVNSVMREAEKAVRTYKFSPAMKDGKPIETKVGLTMLIGKMYREKKSSKWPLDPNVSKPISGGVINGKAIALPKPSYPIEAKRANAGGAVSIQVLISEDGNVLSAQAVSGSPLLQFAAREAACGAKFSPTLLLGNPVKVSGVIVYNFVP